MTLASLADVPRVAAPSFAAVLRQETAAVHREAERAGIIADLIRGRATVDGYALLLRNLVPAYAALEARLAIAGRSGDPLACAFAVPGLARLSALTHDLETLVGPAWASRCRLLPEADAYAAAIAEAAASVPRLAAHAYARYLGDLSGGQILKPVLARTLGLAPEALSFYDFPALADDTAAKAAMRAALDVVPPGSDAAQHLIVEAIAAFRHNIAVSDAVQRAAA